MFALSATNASCATFWQSQQQQSNEQQALESLRRISNSGTLPSESVVAGIEARFPNTKTAALARLLRAYILLQNGDWLNASGLLDTNLIREKTSLGDYALWLRGQALAKAGKSSEAMAVFEKLLKEYPASLRLREASLERARLLQRSGETERVASSLLPYTERGDAESLLLVAQSYEQAGNQEQAAAFYRKLYFFAPASEAAKTAEAFLTRMNAGIFPLTAEEATGRAEKLLQAKKFPEAADAYNEALIRFPALATPNNRLQQLIALANAKRTSEAASVFNLIPLAAGEIKAKAYSELARAYANARQWQPARQVLDEMRRNFPSNSLTSKAIVAVGMIARDQKNKADESFILRSALVAYPNAVEVSGAQFELAWLEHENRNYQTSSQMLIEHLARYVDKDTTYRGRAGYWAARDAERAGKINEACALYDAMLHRYDANWYGYLSKQRLDALRAQRHCSSVTFPPNTLVGQAAANLKTVTVAPERTTQKELERLQRSEELATVALFDFALAEVQESAKTAADSPKVNLTLAKYYRMRGDNVSALLALAKSYPDYSQMKPEEMSKEEWDIFYPLHSWDLIKRWAQARSLDPYTVAGLIRQESVFNSRAASHANAYGLMQLIMPTARAMARKYTSASVTSVEDLFQPALNIELGTAYMREQLDKYGRIEYLAVAYNAGPGRVTQWRDSLPLEIDEYVEAIPFRETKGYVQGVIRNAAQYRRLYDENGKFKPNVGSRPLRGEIDSKSPEQFAREFPEVKLSEQNTE